MSMQKLQCTLAVLVMAAAFVLVAAHVCFLHDGTAGTENCPLCAWGYSLAVGQGPAPAVAVIPLTGWLTLESVLDSPPAHLGQPLSARAPPQAAAS